MGLTNAIVNRPIRVLGFLTAFHSIVYGIGFLTNWGGFNGALVGLEVNSVVISNALGAFLSVEGIVLMYAYSKMNPKTIRVVSYIQGLTWLFITLVYLLNGAYLLAAGIGLSWAVLSVYISYAANSRKRILDYDKTWQAEYDTAQEDTL